MKGLFIRIIIWLFERYAFDIWVDNQVKKQREDFQKRFNLKDDEVEEALIDKSQEGLRQAYYNGVDDGIRKAEEQFYER